MKWTTAAVAALLGGGATLAAAPAQADILIDGTAIYPESIAADAEGNVYATSLDGVVYRAPAGSDTAVPWILPDETNGLLWALGVLPDERSDTLWVCSTPAAFLSPPRAGDAAAVAFDLATGAFKARYVLPKPTGDDAPPSATCNDIAVGGSGKVYLTDTGAGRLYSIAPGADEVTLEAADPLLVGVEGPAFADDNELYLNNTRQNSILRVERDAEGNFEGLTPIATSIPLNGADGFRHYRGNQFLQAETGGKGRITLVTIEGDEAEVQVIAEGTGSAGVAFHGDTVYAAEGKIGYLFDPALKGQDPGPFVIRAFPLP